MQFDEGIGPIGYGGSGSAGEKITGYGLLGAAVGGAVAADAAESILEGVAYVVVGGALGAGVPAAVWGTYKGLKFIYKLATATDND